MNFVLCLCQVITWDCFRQDYLTKHPEKKTCTHGKMRFFSLITSLEKSLCLIYFLVWWVRCVCRYLINRYRWLIFHLTWNTSRVCYLVVFIFWLWISLAFGIWTISFCLGQFDPGRGQSDFEMDMDMLVWFWVEVTAPQMTQSYLRLSFFHVGSNKF